MGCAERDSKPEKPLFNPKDSLQVGMTYDEVERLMGKPTQIDRGANELELAIDNYSLDELQFARAVAETSRIRSVWLAPKKIKPVGQLIYVNWIYLNDSRQDTTMAFRKKWKSVVTQKIVGYKYLINGYEVPKEEYDLVIDTVYRTYPAPEGWITTKEKWEVRKKNPPLPKPPDPEKAIKKMVPLTEDIHSSQYDGLQKHLFLTTSYWCVVFDAASGRVVNTDYYPFFVNEIL